MQERGSELNTGSTEREGRGNAPRVANAARRDNRNLDRIDDLRDERESPDLGGKVLGEEHAAVAARLIALRDHDVGAVLLEPHRLRGDGGGTDDDRACSP